MFLHVKELSAKAKNVHTDIIMAPDGDYQREPLAYLTPVHEEKINFSAP
jgi:hypothetical protein